MVPQSPAPRLFYSSVYPGADQRKHQSSASLAFGGEIRRWPVNSPHKGPATRSSMFQFDDVIMIFEICDSRRKFKQNQRPNRHSVKFGSLIYLGFQYTEQLIISGYRFLHRYNLTHRRGGGGGGICVSKPGHRSLGYLMACRLLDEEKNTAIFIQKNEFENVICQRAGILSRSQCVKLFSGHWYIL